MRAAGWRHSEETKLLISESNQRTKALMREHPLPASKPCGNCHEVKRSKEFSLRRRKLVAGGHSMHLSSWCKRCETQRLTRWRAEQSKAKLREQWRRAYVNRRRQQRVLKGPRRSEYVTVASFVPIWNEIMDYAEHTFIYVAFKNREAKPERLDKRAFRAWLNLTQQQYTQLQAALKTESILFDAVERVLLGARMEHRLNDLVLLNEEALAA